MNIKFYILFSIFLAILNSGFSQEFNYDESKVPKYTLPEVLRSENGNLIKNKKQWEKSRRPEVLKLFEDHLYGQVPKDYDDISFRIINEDDAAMNGMAHLKEVRIDVTRNRNTISINLVMFVPKKVNRPGVFLLINHRDQSNTDPTRNTKSDYWPAELVVQRGYAIAAFHVSDVAPDNKETYQNGILKQLYPEQIGKGNGMTALGAWGWGASRIMDYFQEDKSIDANKVAVIGHSRSGKAALWCGAQDERFAIVISNNSGCGGAALSRRMFGETLKRMNSSFPHWLCENNLRYDDNVEAMPVDQHMLMALMAPRPVYVGSAEDDLWADPVGEFLSLKHAEPVYALYRFAPIPVNAHPGADKPVHNTRMGYFMRKGKHNLTSHDWEQYMNFADNYYRKK
jgi:hypothetical protein